MGKIKLASEIHPLDVQLELARSLPAEDLMETVEAYNWDMFPAEVFSVIARRDDCSLLTALHIFDAAEPAGYEHSPEWADPSILALLQEIHDRINAGAYTHNPEDHLRSSGFSWIKGCLASRAEAKPANGAVVWALDPSIVLPALDIPEHVAKPKRQKRQGLSAYDKQNAENYAIIIFKGGPNTKVAQLIATTANRKVQAHVAELLAEPERIKALIKVRQSKPDALNLPNKSLIYAVRLNRLNLVTTHEELLRKFNPKSATVDLSSFGGVYRNTGFDIEDVKDTLGPHPGTTLNTLLRHLTDKYGSQMVFHDRLTHFVRSYSTIGIKALDKGVMSVRRALGKQTLWAQYRFINTNMFVGLSTYLTGSQEIADQIEAAIPISNALKEARTAYQNSKEIFEERLKIATRFRDVIVEFLDQDEIDLAAWENRPRWHRFLAQHSQR